MRRRRRQSDDSWIGPVCQLAGLAVLVTMLVPGVRQTIFSIGVIVLVLVGLATPILIGIGIYFRSKRIPNTASHVNYSSINPTRAPSQVWSSEQPRSQPTPKAPSTTDVIEQLRSMDWFQFEKVVGHIYQKLGYAVTRRGGANPDGGIDLIVEKDGQKAAVQCKQWKAWNVGVKTIREFLGALTDASIQKGIFITVRGYTGEAKQLAEKHGIVILNETELCRMLEATDAKNDPKVLELLHDTRKFCPKCERELVIRVSGKASNRGNKFWGCSGFPQGCRFTMPVAEPSPKAC